MTSKLINAWNNTATKNIQPQIQTNRHAMSIITQAVGHPE